MPPSELFMVGYCLAAAASIVPVVPILLWERPDPCELSPPVRPRRSRGDASWLRCSVESVSAGERRGPEFKDESARLSEFGKFVEADEGNLLAVCRIECAASRWFKSFVNNTGPEAACEGGHTI